MDVCKINMSFNATEVIHLAHILLVPMLIRKYCYVFFLSANECINETGKMELPEICIRDY